MDTTTTNVPGFGPITCTGCGRPAPISTKIGTPMTCPCGVVHTAVAVVVESTGSCSSPGCHDAKVAEERAARAI
ncbi:MAG TPA: hypothetical protein VGG39_08880 [Polyangiaceae bacterium]|jgi:hypothetical protein